MCRKLNLGIIGLGNRGTDLLKGILLPMTDMDVNVTAVCDEYEDRTQRAACLVKEKCGKEPFATQDYSLVLSRSDVDAVLISASWESHMYLAREAMKAGKITGLEVGGAYSVEECFELVKTYEETGTPFMLLENCCYGERELMVLNMVRLGIFGDVVHCDGGYHHDLRKEICYGEENRHYRLRNYLNRNCENYPTHEIGPIAKVLDINNGNRFVSLTSVSSCSKGLNAYAADRKGVGDVLASAEFAQGDIVTTVIKCAKGQTVTITLDTTLPRAYSRGFNVRGTKASYFEDTDSVFIDKEHDAFEFNSKGLWGNASKFDEKYKHPIWKGYTAVGSHDGIDWLEFRAFISAALDGKPMPIDVYDAAAYMCITPLSEQSIICGSNPVAFPDFTHGNWYRKNVCDWEYNLDRI